LDENDWRFRTSKESSKKGQSDKMESDEA